MKKILFVLTAILALSSFAFTGCKKEASLPADPQNVEENTDTDENETQRGHSDFRFVPKPIKGNAVEYDGDIYIIHFGNRKRHRGVCPARPEKPALPDETENGND